MVQYIWVIITARGWNEVQVVNRRTEDLIPYTKNAKKHDKRQINNVAESIKQYGFVQPIVVDRWENFTGQKAVWLNDSGSN